MLGPIKPRPLDQPIAVSLEALVPVNHVSWHLEAKLDLSFVRDWTRDLHAERGRPRIYPVIFFKLQLVMFFEGIRSERQLIEIGNLNPPLHWYLGYAFDMSKFVWLGMCSYSHFACHYCYARLSHTYLGMNADEDFATKIVVKTNMPDVLRQELHRRSWTRERVAIGTATDAYQPCEGRYQLTRRCLQALRDADTPVSIVTKSTLVLRDLDLLVELAQGPGATVYFTITTLEDALWRLIEPGTPPHKRLAVLRRLSNEGVPCGVFLAPILPGITDSPESIEAVAVAAKAHGAASFGSAVLRLAPQVKEHYLTFVSETFPDLLPRYERAYAGTNITLDYETAIERRVARVRERQGFIEDAMQSPRDDAGGAKSIAVPPMIQKGQLILPL